ncbi:hypothetical protein CPB86DRAFT_817863 [Serendipita vermifera]|nr:hypothetical protein CPB86DRAFT_817863 [Serendipita vermifera]
MFIAQSAIVLSFVASAFAHGSRVHGRRQQASISRSFTGAPYPTGPGFDVPALKDITASSAPEPTVPLPVTFPPGSTPLPLGAGAVGLPDISNFDPTIYPPLDQVPPVDSPEVKAWLAEIQGASIPALAATRDGSCESDPAFADKAGSDGRCWWTCGGCVRETDIVNCQDKERWAITFDDGPSEYTPKLLTYLQSIDTLATFYVVGSRVISHPEMVQTQLMMGHELSIHTWSHRALTTLTNEQIVAELGWCRKAIKDVTGVAPLTFRPPFGDIDDRVRAIALAMNLTPVIWTEVDATHKVDTEDFLVPGGIKKAADTISQFRNTLSLVETDFGTGIISLEHDLFQETVDLAIGFTLPDALSRPGPDERGWTLGNVAQCRGQRPGDSYQETTTDPAVLERLGRTPPSSPSNTPTASPPEPTTTAPSEGSATTAPASSAEVTRPGSSEAPVSTPPTVSTTRGAPVSYEYTYEYTTTPAMGAEPSYSPGYTADLIGDESPVTSVQAPYQTAIVSPQADTESDAPGEEPVSAIGSGTAVYDQNGAPTVGLNGDVIFPSEGAQNPILSANPQASSAQASQPTSVSTTTASSGSANNDSSLSFGLTNFSPLPKRVCRELILFSILAGITLLA